MQEVLLQYGILGAIVVGLSAYVLRIEARHKKERGEWLEDHRKERSEWIESQNKMSDRAADMNDETNRVLRENTNILASLKSLLENRIRR